MKLYNYKKILILFLTLVGLLSVPLISSAQTRHAPTRPNYRNYRAGRVVPRSPYYRYYAPRYPRGYYPAPSYIRHRPHWYFYYNYYLPYEYVYYYDYEVADPEYVPAYPEDDPYYGQEAPEYAYEDQANVPEQEQPVSKNKNSKYEKKSDSAQGPEDEIGKCLMEGDDAFRNKDYKKSVESFRKIIQIDTKNPIGHISLADALFAQGEYGEAATEVMIAIDLDPELVKSNFSKLELYENQDEFYKQLSKLEDAVKKDGKNAKLRLLLGYNYYFTDDIDKAINEFDAIKKANENDYYAGLFLENIKPVEEKEEMKK